MFGSVLFVVFNVGITAYEFPSELHVILIQHVTPFGIVTVLSIFIGYVWFGFIFLTLLCGISVRRKNPAVKIILGVIGLLICHLLGAVQYAVLAHITIGASLVAVSLPYIVKDVISVVGAYLVAIAVRKALYAGNILQDAKAA